MSRSSTWLIALAEPADIAPPASVKKMSQGEILPGAAISIEAKAVTSSKTTMRGLVSAT